MASSPSLVLKRRLKAPPEKVFAAWTQPEQMMRWWGVTPHPNRPIAETDLRVGGRWHFAQVTPDGTEVSFSGEYLELDPPSRTVHTEKFDNMPDSEPATIVTTFTEDDGVTTLRAVCTYDSPQTVAAVVESGMEHGLQSSYDAVDEVLAGLQRS